MTVTTPAGFEAAGVAAGIKANRHRDLALVVNRGPRFDAAAVFTTNRCQANPVRWSRQVAADGRVDAVVLNSGGANCYTGEQGFQTAHATAEAVAEQVGVSAGDVVVCSTGIIGHQLPLEKLVGGVSAAAAELSADGGSLAAEAILTTDTVAKEVAVRHPDGWSIGGIAKGSGMIAPGMATMLVVVTTDAVIEAAELQQALDEAVRHTFNRLDVDGCMSTNDTVTLLSSGASGVSPAHAEFVARLTEVCDVLAAKIQDDAEGASHTIDIEVQHAADEDDAIEVARAVGRSNLFKAAIAGNDPNWGRVLAAVGTTQAAFDPFDIDVTINDTRICHAGQPDRDPATVDLSPRAVHVLIDLKSGEATGMVRTSDLTHEYVEINSEYES
ncbi:bifunctional glutamate N-acetyltransferase/amino-acid acetyltransferase ArgJ [Pseudoclavibacter sp. CFCC 14310]|uniref:bifunctional glutamate N-acetyltransferase/amino-acid acetyltransferase ArgJ n=1 Tax=Pseudoclavibacter sp. CFCC 14310 TaxID=2615180 RepID=UPI0013012F4D|nr:bifunctional glutamate N-acetyltransferase/amino-acid acetyltransferase ArgJ [Pseudoclavibacter sp. CFCC 14310]KAB1647657.1 bifunctional glutamate N-acetyltransferase/amino-acid acetyltransferase ArgJ [Pseudoclavibacter sp. CFCC 14310]